MCDALNTTPMQVAVIVDDSTQQASRIQRYTLDPGETFAVPGVPGLRWAGTHAQGLSPRAREALTRQSTHLHWLNPGHTGPPLADVSGAFVNSRADDGVVNGEAFGEVHLFGQRHHVFARNMPRRPLTDYAEVQFISGVCLFGESGARFHRRDGSVVGCPNLIGLGPTAVDAIDTTPELTFYELEASRRLSAVLGGHLTSVPTTLPGRLVLDVPRIETSTYLLAGYFAGRISRTLLAQWWDLVDQRHRDVRDEFGQRVGQAVKRADRPETPVETNRGLDAAEAVMREVISPRWPGKRDPDPERVLVEQMIRALLRSDDGDEWRVLLDAATPVTLADLVITSYIWPLVRPALRQQRPDSPVLTILVDDLAEQRLYHAARAVLAQLHEQCPQARHDTLAATFPLSKAFHAGVPGTRRLYHSLLPSEFVTETGSVSALELAEEVTSWR